jgi:D-3-phosphoglycerate dehydrogenase
MTTVLIADSLSPSVITRLETEGASVRYDSSLTSDSLPSVLPDFEVLIVRSTKVTRAALSSGRLSLVVRAGAGVDTIDVDSAMEFGVRVSTTPGCNSDAVAELTIGHIIACDRQILNSTADLRRGAWRKAAYLHC